MFEERFRRAKAGDEDAKEKLFLMYRPLLLKYAVVNGSYDEDLYQELCETFIVCLQKFSLDRILSSTIEMQLKGD